ncbi:MAG: hypothetical protein NC048_04480 [Bacteroides sp.]|nr:hypothetical protein [Bacteroides sp.]
MSELNCQYNKLDSLNVSDCAALTELNCSYNNLTRLDLNQNPALTDLNCSYNNLTKLDLSQNPALVNLNCSNNNLASLDVNGCTALSHMECDNNRLRRLETGYSISLDASSFRNNRFPFSLLYNSYGVRSDYYVKDQSDSVTVLIDKDFDLSSERVVGQILSTFELTDAYGKEVPDDSWEENRFVFRFHEPLRYTLKLKNSSFEDAVFTWHISVVEEMPANHYTVKVASGNTAWGTATLTGGGPYIEGEEITITAKPRVGYRFVNWTRKNGSTFSNEAVHTFTVSENLELTANFEERPEDVETFTVSVESGNSDWGRVSITGDGTYEANENVTITAAPNAGYRFVNWTKGNNIFSTEAVYTFAVTEDLELTANFEKRPDTGTFTVKLTPNNEAWGIATQLGDGTYGKNDLVTIIATPQNGYRFVNWTKENGDVFSTNVIHAFAITEDLELTANFTASGVANETNETENFHVYVKDRSICLSENMGSVQVFNAAGICVYSGNATAIPVRQGGLYVVRTAHGNHKVIVM